MVAPPVTAIVLTKDEAPHIGRCIDSLRSAVARICVVDSGSTDDTRDIAHARGAEVYENAWINHASQVNWALDHCDIRTDWVLRLDADEYLEPGLQVEFAARVGGLPSHVHGVLLQRKYHFLGRWIRHGGMHPMYHLRLWRNGSARVEQRWMDEHAVLSQGDTIRFAGAFVDDNRRDVAWWSEKHVRYATLEAVQATLDSMRPEANRRTGAARIRGQAATKRWLKERVYNRLPLGLGPFLYLQYRLFFRLGILDGMPGVAFHILQGFWYRLLVDLRRHEFARAMENSPSVEARLLALERATGLRIKDSAMRDGW